MSTFPISENQQKSQAAERLREATSAILAKVPNAHNCVDGIDSTFDRIIRRRERMERGIPLDSYDDPTIAPGYSPLPRKQRVLIVRALDEAIHASWLNSFDSRGPVFAALYELDDSPRVSKRRARR